MFVSLLCPIVVVDVYDLYHCQGVEINHVYLVVGAVWYCAAVCVVAVCCSDLILLGIVVDGGVHSVLAPIVGVVCLCSVSVLMLFLLHAFCVLLVV